MSGVVVMSARAKGLAAWMAGTEIACIRCDLRKRNMVMEADISTQYLMARLDDGQRKEGEAFEKAKEEVRSEQGSEGIERSECRAKQVRRTATCSYWSRHIPRSL